MSQVTWQPSGEGNVIEWSPLSGTDNAAMVDETVAGHDGDTTYNQNNTGNNAYDAFTPNRSASVPAGATINFVRVRVVAMTTSANTGLNAALNVGGAFDFYNAGGFTATGSYATYSHDFTTNPNTTAAWTVAEVNGTGGTQLLGFGYRGLDGLRVTAVELIVDYTEAAADLSWMPAYRVEQGSKLRCDPTGMIVD